MERGEGGWGNGGTGERDRRRALPFPHSPAPMLIPPTFTPQACISSPLCSAHPIPDPPPFFLQGTPVYASPEQLTGYSADVAWGRTRLGPPCDIWVSYTWTFPSVFSSDFLPSAPCFRHPPGLGPPCDI